MLKALRLFGILFSAATIIPAILFFRGQDQVIMSWTMIGMCGALIFNGGVTYFKTKDKMEALSSIVGMVLLIISLTKFPFWLIKYPITYNELLPKTWTHVIIVQLKRGQFFLYGEI